MTNESVRDLVREIAAQLPQNSRITLRRVSAAPRVQKRVAGAIQSEALIQKARQIRSDEGTPFWHALFDVGEDQRGGVPIEILRSALFHQDPQNDPAVSVRVDDTVAEKIAELAAGVHGRDAMTIDSAVTTIDGSIRYIPMLDFSVKSARPGGTQTAEACVQAIAEPGVLVASGRSFHFYGSRLLTFDEQIRFWARALLLTPIVDERWIAHQMLGGRAALRISANEHGDVPRVVWKLPDASTSVVS